MDNEHITNPGTIEGTGASAVAEPEAVSKTESEAPEINATASVEAKDGEEKSIPKAEEKNATENAEGSKVEAEKDKPEEKPEEKQKYRYEEAELRAACALAGVSKVRIPYALRMLDKSTVKNAEDAEQQVAKLLEDMPEFGAGTQANSTGSNGNFARKAESESERISREFLSGMMGGI